jgi:DNA-binding protein YbaB
MGSSARPADPVEDVLARARTRAAACAEAAEALAGLRGRARSADGAVEAVVDGHGALMALTLAPDIGALGAERIGALIVATTQAAGRAARLRRRTVLDDFFTDTGR